MLEDMLASSRPCRCSAALVAACALTVALPASAAETPGPSNAAPAPGTSASAPTTAGSAPTDRSTEPTVALQLAFVRWVADFRAGAKAAGITEATLAAAFDGAQYLPRVVELDRAQPEFTRTVWDYLDSAVSPTRVARGQDMLQQMRAPADAAAARYGVPPGVLVAIWGIESNFGDHTGNLPTIDALATLGFDGRRESWARGQLLAALKILQSGDITRAGMLGSWAGAMGQTQLLPSNFLAYAVDADGDGRRNIWSSVADAMASTANFLARAGWRAGEAWGVEVRVPPGFDVSRADPQVRQASASWAADGVKTVDGSVLPDFAESTIVLPAGARGPAFLAGPNFRAILRYNNAVSYALAVGLLAQRITGGPGVLAAWPRDLQALSRSQLLALQSALAARGFDNGTPDGVMGPATRDALRRYQRSVGLPADGFPTAELLQRLQQP